MKKTENLSSSSLFNLYFWKWAGPFISCFWGWLLSYLFKCCDTDRTPISQGYGGIILRATSLLIFRVGSFEKFNFRIGCSLCQAKIYQGIPERHKFRNRSHKVFIIQFNSLFITCLLIFLSPFTQYVACLLALLPASQSYFPTLPPLVLSYLSPQCFYTIPILLHCFLSQNLLKSVLSPMALKKYSQQLLSGVFLIWQLWTFSQQSSASDLTLAGFPWAEEKCNSEDRHD